MNCRHCKSPLEHVFLDLGFAPPSNAYLLPEQLKSPELYFPLRLFVCDQCWLVQTEDYSRSEELFTNDYAYFSSVSAGWLKHAEEYCSKITKKLSLNEKSFVIEIASNDGYLLKNFVKQQVPCLGIEPTGSTANAAESLGIPVLRDFFSSEMANTLVQEGKQADLIIGNNVFAHVPDINDFAHGLKKALKPGGTVTLEFPHLLRLIENNQFDTVYHEHYSYLSLYSVSRIFELAGLRVYDVEELSTHGGSLRVYGCHSADQRSTFPSVEAVLQQEAEFGLFDLNTYLSFQAKADRVKNDLLGFLLEQKRLGKKVAAYGAAAKGNTLLNYAGVKPDLIPFVCDAAPSKQGKFLPGSHIPILPPEHLETCRVDFLLILPWNIRCEVAKKIREIPTWSGKFVVAVPELQIQ